MSTPAALTIPVKRRNGKLQSCEPCRSRKLSCDHRLPICGRCARRKTNQDCYYSPAPLTKAPGATASSRPQQAAFQKWRHDCGDRQDVQIVTTQPETTSQPPTDTALDARYQGILSVPSAGILMESATITHKVGFLGETSSSAVVTELNNSLGIHPTENTNVPGNVFTNSHIANGEQQSAAHASLGVVTKADLQNGTSILAFFEPLEVIQQFCDHSLKLMEGYLIPAPIYRIWLDGLKVFVNHETSPEKLERQALRIWRNTLQPMCCNGNMSAMDWALQATGENLRFETLGLLIASVSTIACQLPRWHSLFKIHPTFNKMSLTKETLRLLQCCIDCCKKCGSRNDLMPYLLDAKFSMLGYIHGDTSSEMWEAFSEVCDSIVLDGRHLGTATDGSIPFFLSQSRIRLFNVVYSMDKFLATFLGRPPHLSYRYCVIQTPDDLTDAELCMDWQSLEPLIEQRRADGSIRGRTPTLASWRIVWSKRHELREDVLEIVIGTRTSNLDVRIERVRAREREILEAMPAFVNLNPEELLDNIKHDPSLPMPEWNVPWTAKDILRCLAIHAGIRHTEFLMERVRVNKLKANSDALIAVSRRLLNLALKVHSINYMFAEFQVDQTDMLAFYATPAAGVLAMELLKRDQAHDPEDDFPRSEVLQQLSVLVAALEAVPGEEGNFSICAMGLNAIRKVLDRLLSRSRHPVMLDGGQEFLGTTFGANIGNDAEFLHWLSSVDFDATSWLDASSLGYYPDNTNMLMHAASV